MLSCAIWALFWSILIQNWIIKSKSQPNMLDSQLIAPPAGKVRRVNFPLPPRKAYRSPEPRAYSDNYGVDALRITVRTKAHVLTRWRRTEIVNGNCERTGLKLWIHRIKVPTMFLVHQICIWSFIKLLHFSFHFAVYFMPSLTFSFCSLEYFRWKCPNQTFTDQKRVKIHLCACMVQAPEAEQDLSSSYTDLILVH